MVNSIAVMPLLLTFFCIIADKGYLTKRLFSDVYIQHFLTVYVLNFVRDYIIRV